MKLFILVFVLIRLITIVGIVLLLLVFFILLVLVLVVLIVVIIVVIFLMAVAIMAIVSGRPATVCVQLGISGMPVMGFISTNVIIIRNPVHGRSIELRPASR